MRLVVDTNVVVSAAISSDGPPGRIVTAVLRRSLLLLVDDRIAAEYVEVLTRPTLPGSIERRVAFVRDLLAVAVRVPSAPSEPALPDPDDTVFLAVAHSATADHLITGNLRHFPPDRCGGVSVLTPRDFVDRYANTIESGGA